MLCGLRFFRGLGGALLLALGLPAAPVLAADTIALRFEVYGVAGLHVLTLKSNIDESANRYAITVDYATTGMAGVFVDVKTRAQVRGRLSPTAAQPEAFRKDTRRNEKDRHNQLDYRPDGTVEGGSTPPLPEPVPAAAARQTVDNLTAYFMLERQLARTGSCTLAVPVYDGQYRYDLYFSDAGTKTLPSSGGQKFEGATTACRMTRRNVATGSDSEQDEGAKQGTIWYAKLIPGDLMVPVRMELETQIGGVTAYLAELHGRGVDLKLME
ncbi:MAG TPA: DUF3108 domain-containing protein [Stellaceae bacterium]